MVRVNSGSRNGGMGTARAVAVLAVAVALSGCYSPNQPSEPIANATWAA